MAGMTEGSRYCAACECDLPRECRCTHTCGIVADETTPHYTLGRYWRFNPCGHCGDPECAEGEGVDATAEVEGLRAALERAHAEGELAATERHLSMIDKALHVYREHHGTRGALYALRCRVGGTDD